MPSTTTTVTTIPVCDVCGAPKAYADCQIPCYSTWGNVCKPCFVRLGCKLGLGRGQEFQLASATALDAKFDRWMREVNRSCEYFIGCDTTELADFGLDFDYQAAFAADMSPGVAAAKAIKAASEQGF